MVKKLRYGLGKFTHHEDYIDYQMMIAKHPHYRNMPGAFSSDGKPVWQVSSGKTTGFYRFFEARQQWWTAKADELGLPGKGKELDRWTVAARMIHPTGYRNCLICGERKNVGYFYLNTRLAHRLNKVTGSLSSKPPEPITDVLAALAAHLSSTEIAALLSDLFPKRKGFFQEHGFTIVAFEKSSYLRTAWLSPGFMGDPPYRFDGLHDYCTACRKSNDPGRSDVNMQSYSHDRRAFEWWAEGNWALADTLYNAAGPGKCQLCSPPKDVSKVSPDHIGPLACGFKHLPFFRPTCNPCNSSKNRRMALHDVKDLIEYEERTGESPASWHARPLWDRFKLSVRSNAQAEELSAVMRAMQDLYLRCLHKLLEDGNARFLRTLLHPEYALRSYTLVGLDPAELTFTRFEEVEKDTMNRRSLQARIVRIAFEELVVYVDKDVDDRRVRQIFTEKHSEVIAAIAAHANARARNGLDRRWQQAVADDSPNRDATEAAITELIGDESPDTVETTADRKLKTFMLTQFEQLARTATI